MKNKRARDGSVVRSERVARIFLRPLLERYRALVWLAEAILRPLAMLFGPSPSPQSGPTKKILVFDPGGLGDMMLLLPFLRNLRACYPGSCVTLLANTGEGALLLGCGMVDESIELRIPWRQHHSRRNERNRILLSWPRFIRSMLRLRKEGFDIAFAAGWGGDLRGNLVIWLAGAKRRVGYGYGGGSFLLTDVAEPDLAHPHVADRTLHLLHPMDASRGTDVEAFHVTSDDDRFAAELLALHGVTKDDFTIGIHPGARCAVREWGDERFAEVAKATVWKFGAKILWFNDPARPRPAPPGVDAIPLALSFKRFVAVLSRCQLFLCNDSGPMHVAAALKVPVVAVFGPQRPEWFGPYGAGHRVVIRRDVWCRPCADKCRFEEPYCLRLISVDEVTQVVADVLKGLSERENVTR